ncbi:MAG TPA: hypothetical protein DCQ98_08365 [Planctomycetaceae bacterium]|nr:hypothetical protein [Planctomycetaceae bacterium]
MVHAGAAVVRLGRRRATDLGRMVCRSATDLGRMAFPNRGHGDPGASLRAGRVVDRFGPGVVPASHGRASGTTRAHVGDPSLTRRAGGHATQTIEK